MNIIRKAAIGAAAVAALATGGGLLAASAASATPGPPARSAPITESYTNVLSHTTTFSSHIAEYTFKMYQPITTAPGYTDTATLQALCFSSRHVTRCDFLLTSKAAPHNDLEGVVTLTATGAAGVITRGSEGWTGARGTVVSSNTAPGISSDTFVFTLPVHPGPPEGPAPLPAVS